jgi:hypothetical protein
VPEWAAGRSDVKPLINACAETVATKPFFRQAFRTKRCLVLADGFDEWKRIGKGRVPYRIALKTGELFAFAGIWSTAHNTSGQEQTTFAITTTEANTLVAQIHNRMPVMLHKVDDEILAIDDYRVLPQHWETRLAHYRPGEYVTVLVARHERLQRLAVTFGAEPPKYWQLEVRSDATAEQRARLAAWLGCLSDTVPAL